MDGHTYQRLDILAKPVVDWQTALSTIAASTSCKLLSTRGQQLPSERLRIVAEASSISCVDG